MRRRSGEPALSEVEGNLLLIFVASEKQIPPPLAHARGSE